MIDHQIVDNLASISVPHVRCLDDHWQGLVSALNVQDRAVHAYFKRLGCLGCLAWQEDMPTVMDISDWRTAIVCFERYLTSRVGTELPGLAPKSRPKLSYICHTCMCHAIYVSLAGSYACTSMKAIAAILWQICQRQVPRIQYCLRVRARVYRP